MIHMFGRNENQQRNDPTHTCTSLCTIHLKVEFTLDHSMA